MIGGKAKTKETGVNHIGQIVGIVTADVYINQQRTSLSRFTKWNRLYPGWEDDVVIYLRLDEPQLSFSFDELAESVRKDYPEISDDKLIEMYEKEKVYVSAVAIPIDGVVLLK